MGDFEPVMVRSSAMLICGKRLVLSRGDKALASCMLLTPGRSTTGRSTTGKETNEVPHFHQLRQRVRQEQGGLDRRLR